jgi:hypothetical protein
MQRYAAIPILVYIPLRDGQSTDNAEEELISSMQGTEFLFSEDYATAIVEITEDEDKSAMIQAVCPHLV